MASALGPISEFMTAAADLMNNARTGKPGPTYREVLEALYYGPFIRDAPEEKDLWDVNQLAPVLEVFLWVDWANHADTQLWLARIMDVTEEHSTLDWDPNRDDSYRYAMFLRDADLLKDLNPILERLDHCGVNRAYIQLGKCHPFRAIDFSTSCGSGINRDITRARCSAICWRREARKATFRCRFTVDRKATA